MVGFLFPLAPVFKSKKVKRKMAKMTCAFMQGATKCPSFFA
jgi:hypothetical protein